MSSDSRSNERQEPLPEDGLYWLTVFAPAESTMSTLARDNQGKAIPSPVDGRIFYVSTTYREWCESEIRRLHRQIGVTAAVATREDGEIALYVRKVS